MRRGESKAKGLKRGGRTRSGAAKPKTRAGRKEGPDNAPAKKRTTKALELNESARPSSDDNIPGLKRALAEAYAREAATADVLKVISRSAFDLQKVLDTLVETACRLCEASDAAILLREDESLVVRANHGPIPIPFVKRPLTRAWTSGRAVLDREPVHVDDIQAEEDEFPEGYAMSRRIGQRTIFSVPLLRENEAIGCFAIRRTEVRPFSPKQIELACVFADQAVMAIENARLFAEVQARTREVQESLEYQTAISDVLSVISRSPSQVQPVLDTIAATAQRLCQAEQIFIYRIENDHGHLVASRDVPSDIVSFWLKNPPILDRGSVAGRVVAERRTVHVEDTHADPEYTLSATPNYKSFRTTLGVPLLRDDVAIGVMVLLRAEVQPFTVKQIALITAFADQAVIAIENARLFDEVQTRTKELTEALEQQTATSEVLQVISSSPGELQPVFDAMCERATRVCGAEFGTLLLYEGGYRFRRTSTYGVPPAYAQIYRHDPIVHLPADSVLGRVAQTKQPVHVADLKDEPHLRGTNPATRFVDLTGARSVLGVPMLKEGEL